MNAFIRVITVGDSITLERNLTTLSDISVIARTNIFNEAIRLAKQYDPHVIILNSPSTEIESIQTAEQILTLSPTVKIIIIAANDLCINTTEVIEMAASCYLPKGIHTDELLYAIRKAANDQVVYYF